MDNLTREQCYSERVHSPQWEALWHCRKLLAVPSGNDAIRPSVTLLICESVLFLKHFSPCGSLRISPCHVRVAGRGTCSGFFSSSGEHNCR